MIHRLVFLLFILFAAGCVQPVETLTPSPAAPSLSPSPTDMPIPTVAPSDTATLTLSPTDTATETSSPTPSHTPTLTATSTPSRTATASRTPRPSLTPGPTATADVIEFSYPVTITIVPVLPDNAPPIMRCLLLNYDFKFEPGKLTITRRNKAAYFECIAKET